MKFLDRIKLAVSLWGANVLNKSAKVRLNNPSGFQKTFSNWLENATGGERNTGYVASCSNICIDRAIN